MKIRYSLVALFVMLGMLLAACGGPPPTPTAAPAVKPTEPPAASPSTTGSQADRTARRDRPQG